MGSGPSRYQGPPSSNVDTDISRVVRARTLEVSDGVENNCRCGESAPGSLGLHRVGVEL